MFKRHWRSSTNRTSQTLHKNLFRAKTYLPNAQTLRRGRNLLLIVGSGASLIFWATHQEVVPITGRRRFNCISSDDPQLLEMGDGFYLEVLKMYRGKILPVDHPISVKIREIVSRIVEVSGKTHLNWRCVVVDSEETNAFAVPGGVLVFYTGLFRAVQDEDGMATLLGHEIAHIVAEHDAEKLSKSIVYPILRYAANVKVLPLWVVDLVGTLLFGLPNSRTQEHEADHIGLLLMAKACYDPRSAPKVYEQKAGVEELLYIYKHPNRNRQEKLKELLPLALSFREKCILPRQPAVKPVRVPVS